MPALGGDALAQPAAVGVGQAHRGRGVQQIVVHHVDETTALATQGPKRSQPGGRQGPHHQQQGWGSLQAGQFVGGVPAAVEVQTTPAQPLKGSCQKVVNGGASPLMQQHHGGRSG
jgi:hypothetical protein